MKTIEVICNYCQKPVIKLLKEYTRSLKRGRKFYCNNSCHSSFLNTLKKAKIITKICPSCSTEFLSDTKKKSKTYCTSNCASKHSYYYSENRINAARLSGLANKGNLNKPYETLRIREDWKYKKLKEFFKNCNLSYIFEFPLEKFVFDLRLNNKIMVEFDDKHHENFHQKAIDNIKDGIANKNGYSVIRIPVDSNSEIDIQTFLKGLSMSVNG